MKKLLSIILAVALCLMLFSPTNAEAATKLNKTKLTLNKGVSFTLKLTGAAKNVQWTSSDQSVATVTTSGKVYAVSAGTTNVTAVFGGKKYKCKVTVKDILTEEEALQNVKYETIKTNDGLIAIFTNNNKANLRLDVNATYYDVSGNMLSTEESYIWMFEAGKKSVVAFRLPHDSNYNNVNYDKVDISMVVDLNSVNYGVGLIDDVGIESNNGANNLMAKITNNSKDKIDDISLTALYYSNGNIVGYSNQEEFEIKAGENKAIEFSNPYDNSFEKISFDDYEIIINEAYSYKY